jgi:chromosome segregation ATPase
MDVTTTNIIIAIVSVLGGGGLVGAIVTAFKLKPEKNRLVVDAAEGAVIVQTGVIKSLHDELSRVRQEAKNEVARAQQESAALRAENQQIRDILTKEKEKREQLEVALKKETEAVQLLRQQLQEIDARLRKLSENQK